jgi:NAD(P)-dependent dehydrogenase (short-subunit alcohol dehydrogenase family)
VRRAGALALEGDVTDPASVADVLARATAAQGPVTLAVNAASVSGGAGPFGGGPLADAGPEAFDAWCAAPARAAFTFLSVAGRYARDEGVPATLVQVTGGSARRAMPGRGPWAAGSAGVRALTHAAALELRPHGVHCALLIVDAGIQPLTGTGGRWAGRSCWAWRCWWPPTSSAPSRWTPRWRAPRCWR